jgi:polyisoprenyl-phosphate glycosyltransferase
VKPDLKLSIVIPAYNEESAIADTLGSLIAATKGAHCEIIVIDDGSTDKTPEILQRFDVIIIHHPVNKGYGASVKAGMRRASGEYILTVDADGQHRIEDVLAIMERMYEYDMVVGERDGKGEAGFIRKVGKFFVRRTVNSLARTKVYDFNSGLRVFRKDIAMQYVHLFPNGFSYSTTITIAFLHEGFSVKYLPIRVEKRKGTSTVSFLDGFRTLLLILRLYMLFAPLRVAIPAATVLLTLGSVVLVFDLMNENIQDITVLLLLTGYLTFFFGLVVDQMAHIRREMKIKT